MGQAFQNRVQAALPLLAAEAGHSSSMNIGQQLLLDRIFDYFPLSTLRLSNSATESDYYLRKPNACSLNDCCFIAENYSASCATPCHAPTRRSFWAISLATPHALMGRTPVVHMAYVYVEHHCVLALYASTHFPLEKVLEVEMRRSTTAKSLWFSHITLLINAIFMPVLLNYFAILSLYLAAATCQKSLDRLLWEFVEVLFKVVV